MPDGTAGPMGRGARDLRTRPKPPDSRARTAAPQAPLRAPSPEPAAPRGAAGLVVPLDPLRGGCDLPAVPGPPHSLARPEALYYPGALLPLYPTRTMGSPFPLVNLPTPLYPMMCPMEHPLSADIAMATRADEDGDTPLHIAVVQGNLPAVHRLVNLFQQGGRELDIYNNLRQVSLGLREEGWGLDSWRGWNPRMGCGRDEGRRLLEQSLEKLKDLPSPPQDIKSGRSPLIHAVENNSLSMVQLLLQHGANVNAQMYSGSSALHSASGRGLLPLVRTLVRSGADSSLKNCHNDTPLMVARSRRVIDILRGKAARPASTSQPEPSPDQSANTSPESSSRLSSNGLLSASPSSSPSQSPPKDPPGFPMAPPNFFLPSPSPPAFLPFAGVLRGPGRPVPSSPAPGGS
ncbi:PREDICTED: B-cell lymphoma 3 protein [Rhinopithecus bieti]|uniref:B-cell lymphoma 3 protein n=1 Tax=Rhinopithecus bieti TaxID=61621 RepID=UPI00083C8A44|nr:PREDICTED: B-cell lymphoma 3 protein [Rhinopithecus bieti]